MTTAQSTDEYLQLIRKQRSSESNFDTLYQALQAATKAAEKNNEPTLASELKEADETYAAEYKKAKESGGSAWPEFEKFVTQFERALTNAKKEEG